jgi:ABC-type multidrug transport system fused ATPase/permease subunit
LIGVSGAGKTTIVDLVVGLLEPSAGAVLVDGMSMKNIDLRQFRQRLGIVPQEPVLFNDTIENNIRLQRPTANEAEMEQAAHVAYAHEFIIALPDGYKTVIGERGTKLSGGQRQRIALARSLLANPEILILDEATSALDNESENKIRRALVKLHGKLTILIVAHREKTIEDADVVYEISDGKAEKVSSSYFAHYNRIKD